MMHHNYQKSTVYIMVYSVFSILFGMMCIYPLLQYHTEYFHCLQNPLCSAFLCIHPLSNSWSFYYLHSLAFFRMSSSWNHAIHSKIAFADWFLSLSNKHLKFFHVFPWLDSSFYFLFFYFFLYYCIWILFYF